MLIISACWQHCGSPLTQQCPAAWMEPDLTRDKETHNREQRPSESYNRSGGENRRQQGQRDTKSIICLGQTSQPLSFWCSVPRRGRKEKSAACLCLTISCFLFYSPNQAESRLLLWSQHGHFTKLHLWRFIVCSYTQVYLQNTVKEKLRFVLLKAYIALF